MKLNLSCDVFSMLQNFLTVIEGLAPCVHDFMLLIDVNYVEVWNVFLNLLVLILWCLEVCWSLKIIGR